MTFKYKDTNSLKVKKWIKKHHANGNQKKAGVAILTSDKVDFRTKNITGDKEGYFIMIKCQLIKRM